MLLAGLPEHNPRASLCGGMPALGSVGLGLGPWNVRQWFFQVPLTEMCRKMLPGSTSTTTTSARMPVPYQNSHLSSFDSKLVQQVCDRIFKLPTPNLQVAMTSCTCAGPFSANGSGRLSVKCTRKGKV